MTDAQQEADQILQTAQAQIQRGDFASAQKILDSLLETAPQTRDALYMKAVCARYMGDHAQALRVLADLIAIAPEFGRAFQEEGHIYFEKGDHAKALAAYQAACRYNPALDASWRRQAEILSASERAAEAYTAGQQARWLQGLPRELTAAMHHFHEGRLLKAEGHCRAYLRKHPKDTNAMRLLADIGDRFNVLDDVEFLLESAVAFEPDNVSARIDYMRILRKRQKYAESLKQAERLAEKHPNDTVIKSHLAIESMHNNAFERAFELFDQVLDAAPGNPATLTSKGHAKKTFGAFDEAVQSYRAAYRSAPEHGEAWFGLANLKTYRFTDDEIDQMRSVEASGRLTYQARIQVCFALGKAFEDNEQYGAAFDYYNRGNEMKRLQSHYDADQMAAEFQAQIEHCSRHTFERLADCGFPAPDPIFIVGLPRAGSTLLEQILASHSQIDGTLELPNVLAQAHRLRGRIKASDQSAYPANLNTLSAEQAHEFGKKYIDDTRVHRAGARYFIDKMPNNFRHLGLIALILPNAKIIDARREPMACCFSGFKQLFAEGQEFTYGLEQIGRYYRGYVELMRHWESVLPGRILRVQHEDVLDDLETQVRRILDFCGVPFEPQCLEFYKTERTVRTASSEQVRRPISKSAVDQWRRFEPYLAPLKDALGPALTEYRA